MILTTLLLPALLALPPGGGGQSGCGGHSGHGSPHGHSAHGESGPKVKATNTTCPVLGGKVSEKSKTVVVRGHEYRLCCAGCDTALLKDPDKYLAQDGTPKNAKK